MVLQPSISGGVTMRTRHLGGSGALECEWNEKSP
jgi:hypothetical protein